LVASAIEDDVIVELRGYIFNRLVPSMTVTLKETHAEFSEDQAKCAHWDRVMLDLDPETQNSELVQLQTLRSGVAKKWLFPPGPPEPRRAWQSFGWEMVQTLCALLGADARLTDAVQDVRAILTRVLTNECGAGAAPTFGMGRNGNALSQWRCNALALRVSGVECEKCGVSSELDVSRAPFDRPGDWTCGACGDRCYPRAAVERKLESLTTALCSGHADREQRCRKCSRLRVARLSTNCEHCGLVGGAGGASSDERTVGLNRTFKALHNVAQAHCLSQLTDMLSCWAPLVPDG